MEKEQYKIKHWMNYETIQIEAKANANANAWEIERRIK